MLERLEPRRFLAGDLITVQHTIGLVDQAWVAIELAVRDHIDLNRDGLVDRIQRPEQFALDPSFTIHLAQSDGSEQSVTYPISSGFLFSVGDLNNDGYVDVLAQNSSGLHKYLNDGNGVLDTIVAGPELHPEQNSYIEIADVDGDGHNDLIVGMGDYDFETYVEIWRGDDIGEFRFETQFGIWGPLTSTHFSDINGDGVTDALLGHLGTEVHNDACEGCPNGIALAIGNADGTFQDAIDIYRGEHESFFADVDGDGFVDVTLTRPEVPITLRFDEVDSLFSKTLHVDVLDGLDIGAIPSVVPRDWGYWHTSDLDSDGHPDWLNFRLTDTGTHFSVLWGAADGQFQQTPGIPLDRSVGRDFQSVDYDNDGDQDAVIFASSVYALENQGDRQLKWNTTFTSASIDWGFWPNTSTSFLDLNGDAYPDIVGHEEDTAVGRTGDGLGQWEAKEVLIELPASVRVELLRAVDMNNDGQKDLLVIAHNRDKLEVIVALRTGDVFSQTFRESWDAPYFDGFAVDDFDGDGILDVAISNQIRFGRQGGTLSAPITLATAGQLVHTFDIDGNGSAELVYNGSQLTIVRVDPSDRSLVYSAIENLSVIGFPFAAQPLIHFVDLNQDRIRDLVTYDVRMGLRYFLGTATNEFVATDFAIIGAGSPRAVYDVDNDGDNDIIATADNELTVLWNNTVPQPNAVGDFDADGDFSASDLDMMWAAISRSTNQDLAQYDLNDDDQLDELDAIHWIEKIKGTKQGDVDLDGDIDFADFLTLSAHFGARDATWSTGDLNADQSVGFDDFLLLSGNFGFKEEQSITSFSYDNQ